jgi:hypothetical protein
MPRTLSLRRSKRMASMPDNPLCTGSEAAKSEMLRRIPSP